jgi:hypothetical protein
MPVVQRDYEDVASAAWGTPVQIDSSGSSTTWLVRLRHGSLELSQRVVKLNQFLRTPPFQARSYRDQDLRSCQYQAMNAYLFILRERIIPAGANASASK